MKDADYSGLVILSNEHGEYLSAFLRKDGRQQRVKLSRGIPQSERASQGEDSVLMRLNLGQTPSAMLMRTNDSEDGPVDIGFVCSGCGTSYPYATLCEICYPIIVTPDQNPDPSGPHTFCTNPECPYGGGVNCNGLCGYGGGGGGSGSGSGSGGGGTFPSQPGIPVGMHIDLLDRSKFVGYHQTGDCLLTAKAIMDNYGLKGQYGGSNHVYQLMWEERGMLKHYGVDYKTTFGLAYKCIKRHLEAGRPIIVGVDRKLGLNSNEGTTDHWILVTGRGYDDRQKMYYFTYMETGTDFVDKGCNNSTNRLYYEIEKVVLFNPSANDNKSCYTVSQVRPNDGKNLEETISQPTKP